MGRIAVRLLVWALLILVAAVLVYCGYQIINYLVPYFTN